MIFNDFRSLFNSNQQLNSNPFLLSSLFYPPPPLLFQSDSSFRLYHEAFFRNLLDQYCPPQPPLSLLLPPPNLMIPSVSIEKESHVSSTGEKFFSKKIIINIFFIKFKSSSSFIMSTMFIYHKSIKIILNDIYKQCMKYLPNQFDLL